jgi:hypothetical protein
VTDPQIDSLRQEIRAGFQSIGERLDAIEKTQDEGFHDVQQGLHGIMFKLLAGAEITEIRASMKNAPAMENFPRWVIR